MADAAHLRVMTEFLQTVFFDLTNTFFRNAVAFTDVVERHGLSIRLAYAKAQLGDLKLTLQQGCLDCSRHLVCAAKYAVGNRSRRYNFTVDVEDFDVVWATRLPTRFRCGVDFRDVLNRYVHL